MINIIKLAMDKNIGIYIKPMDGTYRPLVGYLDTIVTLTRGEECYTINITRNMSNTEIELAIDEAIRKLTYEAKA